MTNEPGEGGKTRAAKSGATPAKMPRQKKPPAKKKGGAGGRVSNALDLTLMWAMILVPIALILWLGASCVGNFKDGMDEQDKKMQETRSQREAEDACKDLVRQQLKSPGSADFQDPGISGQGGTYTIVGTVDSQNSFGALVRLGYTCDMSGGTGTATVTE